MNTKKQVEDFMIEYAINSVLEQSQCEIKHERTVDDFIENAKHHPIPSPASGKQWLDGLCSMIVDFFGADEEFRFEVARKMERLRAQIKSLKESQNSFDG